jgi:hypothetical protein
MKESASMSQKLSLSSIAATLAALSASGLIACGGQATAPVESPADAKEVPAAALAGTEAPVQEMPKADPEAKAAEVHTADAAPAEPAADAAKATVDPTSAPAAAAKTSDKPKAAVSNSKKKAGAKAGCGAGTCG